MNKVIHVSKLEPGIYEATVRTRYTVKGMEWLLFEIGDQMVVTPITGAPKEMKKGDTFTIALWREEGIIHPYLIGV